MRKIIAALAVCVIAPLFTMLGLSVPAPAQAASCYPPSGAVSTINSHQKTDPNPWTELNVRNYIGCYSDTCPGTGCSKSPLVWAKANGEKLYVYFDYNSWVKYACSTSGTSCWVPAGRVAAKRDSSWPWKVRARDSSWPW